jgi:hypothetical protein
VHLGGRADLVSNDACPDVATLNTSAASTQTPTALQALMMLGM